jgi:hypothetical protein
MKRTMRPSGVRVLTGILATGILVGLSPRPTFAETNRKADEKKPGEQVANIQTTSGGFTIAVDRVRRASNHPLRLVPTGFPLTGEVSSHSETHDTSQGLAGGAGAGMGGGSGSVFNKPNLILDVGLTGPSLSGKRRWVCTIDGQVRALDDHDREADSPGGPSWMSTEFGGVEYRREPGRTAIHLYVPTNPEAKYLRTVEGKLLVAEGFVNQATFQGSDLSRPTTKKPGPISFRLDKVQTTTDGVEVTVGATPAPSPKAAPNPLQNPAAALRSRLLSDAPGRVTVVLRDSDGNTHSASVSPSSGYSSSETFETSSDGNSTTTRKSVTRSSSSAAGGFGSTSPGRKKHGAKWTSQSGAGSSGGIPMATVRFDPLPDGVKVESIVCTTVDLTDTPKSVPFRLENVPLPDSDTVQP